MGCFRDTCDFAPLSAGFSGEFAQKQHQKTLADVNFVPMSYISRCIWHILIAFTSVAVV
jgi:hypothetical protein